ncbi:MAG: acetyltransferase [Eubacterium sp.]|nr:acetyltransferase [Eubacterium sp.]
MLNIHIKDDILHIKNIDKNSINNIYSIYSNSDEFKYATGIFHPIGYDQFSYQISQFIQRKNVFFLDICLLSGETIGLIKGSITNKADIVWINSMVINTPYQSNGYGKRVLALLENYFSSICSIKEIYLSVCRNNISGINFWSKCGYCYCNQISKKDSVKLNEMVQIMYKLL